MTDKVISFFFIYNDGSNSGDAYRFLSYIPFSSSIILGASFHQ